jgi:hypothetical protein
MCGSSGGYRVTKRFNITIDIDDDGALRSAFLAKIDGSSVCPTGFNVPTEAQLKAEKDIWDTTNNPAASASANH